MTAPETAAAQVETLMDNLPPAGDETQEQELLGPESDKQPRAVAVLTDEDLESIEEHIENMMQVVADNSAEMLPESVRDQYINGYMKSKLIRQGVRLSGLGEVMHELMPPAGKAGAGAPGPVRQLHPAFRIVLGVAVMGLGAFLQQKAVLSTLHKGQ